MNFSDWLLTISIIIAVILVIIKKPDFEIIKRKKHFVLLSILLILIIVFGSTIAFFSCNPHPKYLNIFWQAKGLKQEAWPAIWVIILLTYLFLFWRHTKYSKPTEKLIKKYIHFLEILNKHEFLRYFDFYEKHATKKGTRKWIPYYKLLEKEKWWNIAPDYFKESIIGPVLLKPENKDWFSVFLATQLNNIPKSLIANEIKDIATTSNNLPNTLAIKTLLGDKVTIEYLYNNKIFLPIIRKQAETYFYSVEFINDTKRLMLNRPAHNKTSIQSDIKIFYYVELINIYMLRCIQTNTHPNVVEFYVTWVQMLLHKAPNLEINVCAHIPNLFIEAVNIMHDDIVCWLNMVQDTNPINEKLINEIWELQYKLLAEIEKYTPNKYSKDFLETYTKDLIEKENELKRRFKNNFEPNKQVDFRTYNKIKQISN